MKKLAVKTLFSIGILTFIPSLSLAQENTLSTPKDIRSVDYNPNVARELDALAGKIRDYQYKNPDATDAELNSYVEELIISRVGNNAVLSERRVSRQSYELDSYVEGYLNDEEKRLYSQNKAKALLCMANGKLALEISKNRYSSGLHNGNGDAFRHALWNAGMVKDVGADFAKKWSDAHEYGSKGQPKIEQTMDLYNNNIGINIAKSNKFLSVPAMADFIQKEVRAGKMKIIVNGKLVSSNSDGEKK